MRLPASKAASQSPSIAYFNITRPLPIGQPPVRGPAHHTGRVHSPPCVTSALIIGQMLRWDRWRHGGYPRGGPAAVPPSAPCTPAPGSPRCNLRPDLGMRGPVKMSDRAHSKHRERAHPVAFCRWLPPVLPADVSAVCAGISSPSGAAVPGWVKHGRGGWAGNGRTRCRREGDGICRLRWDRFFFRAACGWPGREGSDTLAGGPRHRGETAGWRMRR